MRPLHNAADRDGEMLTAFVALIEARTMALALKALDPVRVGVAAMGAVRAIRPANGFKMGAGGVLIVSYIRRFDPIILIGTDLFFPFKYAFRTARLFSDFSSSSMKRSCSRSFSARTTPIIFRPPRDAITATAPVWKAM
jgi:hypothetical protein